MASGMPSSRRQMRMTAARDPSRVKPGSARRARSTNSSMAPSSPPRRSGAGTARPATRHTCSPGTPRLRRLVARMRSPAQARSSAAASGRRVGQVLAIVEHDERGAAGESSGRSRLPRRSPERGGTTTAAAWGTMAASAIAGEVGPPAAASVERGAPRRARATGASPTPPGPMSVSSRVPASSAESSASSRRRPIRPLSSDGSRPAGSTVASSVMELTGDRRLKTCAGSLKRACEALRNCPMCGGRL